MGADRSKTRRSGPLIYIKPVGKPVTAVAGIKESLPQPQRAVLLSSFNQSRTGSRFGFGSPNRAQA